MEHEWSYVRAEFFILEGGKSLYSGKYSIKCHSSFKIISEEDQLFSGIFSLLVEQESNLKSQQCNCAGKGRNREVGVGLEKAVGQSTGVGKRKGARRDSRRGGGNQHCTSKNRREPLMKVRQPGVKMNGKREVMQTPPIATLLLLLLLPPPRMCERLEVIKRHSITSTFVIPYCSSSSFDSLGCIFQHC